jgi:predicted RNase H-like HicB family nuclease
MSTPRHFDSFTSARSNLRGVLDAAHEGLITTVVRENECFVVVVADSLRRELSRLLPSRAAVVAEGGGWSAVLPGVPVHGDAETFDEAIDDLIDALREYAEDWNTRLHRAPNHQHRRSIVELVELSDDAQLRDWLLSRDTTQGAASAALVTA